MTGQEAPGAGDRAKPRDSVPASDNIPALLGYLFAFLGGFGRSSVGAVAFGALAVVVSVVGLGLTVLGYRSSRSLATVCAALGLLVLAYGFSLT